jgi:hypothetical protein
MPASSAVLEMNEELYCIWIYETGGTDLLHNDGICNGSKTKQSVNMLLRFSTKMSQKRAC